MARYLYQGTFVEMSKEDAIYYWFEESFPVMKAILSLHFTLFCIVVVEFAVDL